jgi:uncharacterized tellurite resistance protein B-like protein
MEYMLNFIKNIFTENVNNHDISSNINKDEQIKVATCALFLEVANSDDSFSQVEKDFIIKTMKEKFEIEDDLVEKLLQKSITQTKSSIGLYEFTKIINESFSKSEKIEIVKNLWQLVFIDGILDKYEEYFIRKISNNLNLSHTEIIATKLEAKKEAKN